VPLDSAATQNSLGDALLRLGERESGTAHLEEAVAAHRAALEERTVERTAIGCRSTGQRQRTTSALALENLGERESGTARLEEAVAAYRGALEEWTRDRVSLQWAYSVHGLANALAELVEASEERCTDGEALTCMRNAVEAYRRGREPTGRQ
jgi:hypothetical protein